MSGDKLLGRFLTGFLSR